MTNPLLTPFSLPPFSAIKPEHVVPAVTKALDDCRAAVESAVAHGAPYSWENLCQPLAEVDDVLGRIFSPVSHLNSVKKQPGTARSLRTDPAAALRVQYLGWPA
ncbi:oligopeptidase A [Klebsiella aerogenes]|nr:oligopeptidase A [Klebsiella aerogenes]